MLSVSPCDGPLSSCALKRSSICCLGLVYWLWLSILPLKAITIDVRLMCNVSGSCGPGDFFFDYPEALDTLRFAARAFEPFADNLALIPPTPPWTAIFTDPDSGTASFSLENLSVLQDTFVIFVGGYDMPLNQVAEAGPGKGNISLSRGQGIVAGPAAMDFATWGGSLAFDTLDNGTPRNWHFGVSTLPGPGQTDFLTIAFHELAHVFGFGTAPSFDNLITGDQFQGAATINLTGSTVALAPDKDHWASGTTSPPYADPPLSSLTASLVLGRRRILTPLDFAALADTGWEVPQNLLGLHGDIDSDGDVDGRDFLRWQRTVGSQGVGLLGDADGSLAVDDFDLWLWKVNYGRFVADSAPLRVLPEPRFGSCTLTALLTLWSRRPKRLQAV